MNKLYSVSSNDFFLNKCDIMYHWVGYLALKELNAIAFFKKNR